MVNSSLPIGESSKIELEIIFSAVICEPLLRHFFCL